MIISHHLYFTRARIYDITRKSSQKEEKKGRRRGRAPETHVLT
jgi:hypothetical protein